MQGHHSTRNDESSFFLWAWQQPALTPCQRLTLLALVHHADTHGRTCLSQAALASFAGISRRSVPLTIECLSALGLISVHPQARGKHGSNSNIYQVLADGYDR